MSESVQQFDSSQRVAMMEKNLSRQIDWIGKHDTKTSIVLGITTAMLGVLAHSLSKVPDLPQTQLCFTLLAFGLLGAVLVFLYVGNFPRTDGSSSLIFFGSIAKEKRDRYMARIREQTPEGYLEDLTNQCHVVSTIVDRKFRSLQWAYRMLFLSIAPWAESVAYFNLG